LELNGKHRLLVYTDDVNLLDKNINKIKQNTGTILETSRDIFLEINAEKTKCVTMSRHQNSGQNQNIWIAYESFGGVEKLKHLRTSLKNQNDIHDEIKDRRNSENACSYSVQNILSSHLTSQK
jgi:hypothetical protein